jgi:hypothetical protein
MPKPKHYKSQMIINCASCKHFLNRNIYGDPGTQCDNYSRITPHREKPIDFEPHFNGWCKDWEKQI